MKRNNLIPLLLSLCLLLCLCAGCGRANPPALTTDPSSVSEPSDLTEPIQTEAPIEFSEEEIIAALQEFFNLYGAGAPTGLLSTLGMEPGWDLPSIGENFLRSDILFETFYEEMMNRMSSELYEEQFSRWFKDQDGYLCFFAGGESGMFITVQSIQPNNYGLAYTAEMVDATFDENTSTFYITFDIGEHNGHCTIAAIEW